MSQHFTLVVQQVQPGSLDCTFNLRTPLGVQHGRLASSAELLAACARWRELYSTYYRDVRATVRARRAGQGTLTATALPLAHALPPHSTTAVPSEVEIERQRAELRRAERRLKSQFDRWLLQSNFVPVRDLLREQLRQSGDFTLTLELAGELQHLPWELWDALDLSSRPQQKQPRVSRAQPEYGKLAPGRVRDGSERVRILAIFGDDFGIDLAGDEQVLRDTLYGEIRFLSLRTLAQERGQKPGALPVRPTEVLQAIREALCDPRGWDLLFFAGHSDASENLGGQIAIAPHTTIPFEHIAEQFATACGNGLQIAIFNSCTGIDIARSLLRVGLPQALVMREPIHNELAEIFLKEFLVHFAQGADLHTSNHQACVALRNRERDYPSAHLIPSVFQHPQILSQSENPTGLGYFKRLVRSFSASAVQVRVGQTVRLRVELSGASSLELRMGRERYVWPLHRAEMAFAIDSTTQFDLTAQHTVLVNGESQVITQHYPLTVEVLSEDRTSGSPCLPHRETLRQCLERAQRASQAKQYTEALSNLESAARLAPTHGGIQLQLAWTLRRLERLDEAAAAFRRAASLQGDDQARASAYHGLGLVCLLQGQLRPAIDALTRAIELDPFNADIRAGLAQARQRHSEFAGRERKPLRRSLGRQWRPGRGRQVILLASLLGLGVIGAGIALLWQYRHFKPGLMELPDLKLGDGDPSPVISQDGHRLLWQYGSQAKLYDLSRRRPIEQLLPPGSDFTVSGNWQLGAFITERQGTPDIAVYNLRSGRLLELPALGGPNTSAPEGSPNLSADGSLLAFTSNRTGDLNLYLYSLAHQENWPSEQLSQLNSPRQEHSPSLSGDGQQLAFISDRSGIPDLYLYDLRNRRLLKPTDLPGLNTGAAKQSPSLSGDGQTLAFVSGGDLYLYDLTRRVLLKPSAVAGLNSSAAEASPSLSGDGRYITLTSKRSGQSLVYLYDRGPAWLRWLTNR